MIVYRVEDEWGDGPYLHYHKLLININEFYSPNTPGPQDDGIPNCILYRFPHFAFQSLEDLSNWFNIKSSLLNNFYIKVYDVPNEELYQGEKQLVFNKDLAQLIMEYKIQND